MILNVEIDDRPLLEIEEVVNFITCQMPGNHVECCLDGCLLQNNAIQRVASLASPMTVMSGISWMTYSSWILI